MGPYLTLLTCTRNGSSSIGVALEAVSQQTGVDPSAYEVLVVDNGSSDGTSEIAEQVLAAADMSWRILSEEREGKVNALLRGAREARGEVIAIVDDDNIVATDFVARVIAFFEQRPDMGMLGSANRLDGMAEPDWFHPVRRRFACGTASPLGDEVEKIDEDRVVTDFSMPPGAGSSFRSAPLIEALEGGFFFLNDAFRGRQMGGGEDTELCFLFARLGWRFGIDRALHVRHRLRPDRVTWSYGLKLSRSIGAGAAALDLFSAHDAGNLETFRGSWWWLAGRRCKRLLDRIPSMVAAGLAGRHHDPLWFDVHTDYGALRRLLTERGALVRAARHRAALPWARLSPGQAG